MKILELLKKTFKGLCTKVNSQIEDTNIRTSNMPNSLKMCKEQKGEYIFEPSGDIDHKVQSSFVSSFYEYQAKVDIEKQKTLQKKHEQLKSLWSSMAIVLSIFFIAYVVFEKLPISKDSDAVKIYKIDSDKNLSLDKFKFEVSQNIKTKPAK